MKHVDPVMQEVWQAKEANDKKHQNLAAYMSYLRKHAKRKHAVGRVACSPAQAQSTN